MEELKKLIKGCASGDVRAQEKLYRMLAPKMFGVCLRYAKDRTEAEDNLQDGFIKVFENIRTFRHEGSFEGWVRRIMVNISLGKFKKQNVLHPVEDIAIYDQEQLSEDVYAKLGADDLMELVQQLPPRYRMVFNLYVLEGFNHQEISEALNISEGTSKSNLARAREILKRKVLDLYNDIGMNTNYPA